MIPNLTRFEKLSFSLLSPDVERLLATGLATIKVLRITLLTPMLADRGPTFLAHTPRGTPHVYSGHFPSLALTSITCLELRMALTIDRVHGILRDCTQLEDCTFFVYTPSNIRPEHHAASPVGKILCRALKRCVINIDVMFTGTLGDIIDPLVLPALDHLQLLQDALNNWTWTEVIALLRRCNCDLRSLSIGPYTSITGNQISDILSLTPNLTELALPSMMLPTRAFFEKLGSGEYLPRLKTLYVEPRSTDKSTDFLLDALEERRRLALLTQLFGSIDEVLLDWKPYRINNPVHVSRFKKLQTDGVTIRQFRRLFSFMELSTSPLVNW